MNKRLLVKNTISSIIFQTTAVVCGFILPRLILGHFGSEVNGLVSSITQFLQIITFLELGVGAVVESSLYKPLAEKDSTKISEIVVSANKFFKKLAIILSIYVVVLVFLFPYISENNFSWMYTATLILSISVSSFAQYYFGVVDRLLLTSDQHGYIQFNAQTITLILNTVACVILIEMDASIQFVKLTTSIIFLGRPLFLRLYVNKNYSIDRSITYIGEPIKQKWNGIAQHIAAIAMDNTPVIVLTIFATLTDVSIYSVYCMVVMGMRQLIMVATGGISPLIGNLWAKQELERLNKVFSWTEWVIHTGVVFLFGCTSILIVPFISVYTFGITDANYLQPIFAVLLVLTHAGRCLRLPYNILILAGGHYKETQSNYVVATVMNIAFSIFCTYCFGLVGVAVGSFVALYYQMFWMADYDSKNFIKWDKKHFYKQLLVDFITIIIATISTKWIVLENANYFSWLLMSLKVTVIYLFVILLVNIIFYKEKLTLLYKKIACKLA